MCYFEYPPEIQQMKNIIKPYRAHSREEDRGDGFIEGTPEHVLRLQERVLEYVTKMTTGTNGKPLM